MQLRQPRNGYGEWVESMMRASGWIIIRIRGGNITWRGWLKTELKTCFGHHAIGSCRSKSTDHTGGSKRFVESSSSENAGLTQLSQSGSSQCKLSMILRRWIVIQISIDVSIGQDTSTNRVQVCIFLIGLDSEELNLDLKIRFFDFKVQFACNCKQSDWAKTLFGSMNKYERRNVLFSRHRFC